MKKNFYFFVGTTAELIKVFPVMKEMSDRKIPFKVISSGQNDIVGSELLEIANHPEVDFILSDRKIKQTSIGLLVWFFSTFTGSIKKLRAELSSCSKDSFVLVHGDTVSTVMGAWLAKIFRLKVGHIEAGLRSFNFLHPFPEEIDRVLVSKVTDVSFCPNSWAVANLAKNKSVKVDTKVNTLADSMDTAVNLNVESRLLKQIADRNYFVFVMHRQENLFSESFVRSMVKRVVELSKKTTCIFVLHAPTEMALSGLNLLDKIKNNPNIVFTKRLPYLEFMQVLSKSDFMITDGGSNQEESYYLGKPCLILREHTERIEGLGENVVLAKNDAKIIDDFISNPSKFSRKLILAKESPSKIIVDYLATGWGENK